MKLFKLLQRWWSPEVESGTRDYHWAGKSDVGKVRPHNEDYWQAVAEQGLWVVCDGMGGHRAGELASRIAVETIVGQVKNGRQLPEAILAAHAGVHSLENDPSAGKQPGTTVVILLLDGDCWQLAWVGDSRCWLVERGKITQISHDHTVVQQLVDWGDITAEEAVTHPDRNRLSQAVGQEGKPPIVGKADGTLQAGMTFLLATDGMAHWNEPDTLAEVLAADDLQVVVDQLVADSLEAGGHDNVTCVVVRAEG